MNSVSDSETGLRWLTEASESKLTSAAFDVAMRWADYNQYGSEQAACKALQRRCSGHTTAEYVETLHKAVRILEAAHRCLQPHIMDLKGKSLNVSQQIALSSKLEAMCPGFERSWYAYAVWWTWYTDCLKAI